MAQQSAWPRRGRNAWRWWESAAPYVFISPFFILFAIFGAFPILYSFWISFHEWRGLRAGPFIGLANYSVLISDPQFLTALTNTLFIGLVYVAVMLAFSLGFAAILNTPIRFRSLYRVGYFLPVITSLVVVGILFGFFFGSPYSPFGTVLGFFGIPTRSWMGEVWFIKPAIISMLLWRWTGYNMMIMLAGLQTIPLELYDAGRIDGASAIQAFRYITVPLMRRVIAFSAILSTIGSFNLFDEVYVLTGTGGGIQQAGLVTGLLIYRTAFQSYRFGYASAIAYGVAVIIIGLSLLQVYASERRANVE